MEELSDGPFRARLVTRGRRTGREHVVWLRGVMHNGRIYFSRHRPDSDWFKNAVADPRVTVMAGPYTITGTSSVVNDEALGARISELKYPGEERARERRVTIEIIPDGL